MKTAIAIAALALVLSGCTVASGQMDTRAGLEPIPGSITYGGQPRTKLTRSPVGSIVRHTFRNELGQRVDEVYVIEPDRSLKIVSRKVCRGPFCDD
ncbi:hypothetical protein [Ciceribacter sp. L1K22]|uniref:hypothetical protein n=1 Tax=Ciceribacter sp. L1K22 TaxID=2820275 RepID=UPI001ABE22CD|nr:hypothetical protein [Ciceribacter sp. L1K22]MBO3759381.1 hypothetical protein [Ciceribacter sp. L1K22]